MWTDCICSFTDSSAGGLSLGSLCVPHHLSVWACPHFLRKPGGVVRLCGWGGVGLWGRQLGPFLRLPVSSVTCEQAF